MTIFQFQPASGAYRRLAAVARLALASALLLPFLEPAQAQAQSYGRGWQRGYRPVPVRQWQPNPYQQPRVIYDDPTIRAYAGQPVVYGPDEQARRCNRGRLVGGLLGGGAGYVLANGQDRIWATPLGALLGSQIGCNAVQGNAPLPW
jgi:hypothetical protein